MPRGSPGCRPGWRVGERCGIGLVWFGYVRQYGLPRPVLGLRFLRFLRRGRSVCLIQVAQTVIGSADLIVVGLLSQWADIGRYGATHRMIDGAADLRADLPAGELPDPGAVWRQTTEAGRERSTRWSRCWSRG